MDIIRDPSHFTCIVMAAFSFLSGIASRSLQAYAVPFAVDELLIKV